MRSMSDERKEMESRKAENVRKARCLSIDGRDVQGHPKELRFSNKYYHHAECWVQQLAFQLTGRTTVISHSTVQILAK